MERLLSSSRQRHQVALMKYEQIRKSSELSFDSIINNEARKNSTTTSTTTTTTTSSSSSSSSSLEQLAWKSQSLRDYMTNLRNIVNQRAIDVASATLRNEQRQASLLQRYPHTSITTTTASNATTTTTTTTTPAAIDASPMLPRSTVVNQHSLDMETTTASNDSYVANVIIHRQQLQRLYAELVDPMCHSHDVAENHGENHGGTNTISDSSHIGIGGAGAGALVRAIAATQHEVQVWRFRWALQAFRLYRIQVEDPTQVGIIVSTKNNQPLSHIDPHATTTTTTRTTTTTTTKQKQNQPTTCNYSRDVRGIGKIAGLPLPHSESLYSVLPTAELRSALRLVAVVTLTVASCLSISLPHPIILDESVTTYDGYYPQDIASYLHENQLSDNDALTQENEKNWRTLKSLCTLPDSLIELAELPVRGAQAGIRRNANHWTATPEMSRKASTPLSMDPSLVEKRIQHATAAVIADSSDSLRNLIKARKVHSLQNRKGSGSESITTPDSPMKNSNIHDVHGIYVLSPPPPPTSSSHVPNKDYWNDNTSNDDQFSIALQLLQNNVVSLCVRAGVPVDRLWPAEAILLNLHALWEHCQTNI
jgi:hypothetical protein